MRAPGFWQARSNGRPGLISNMLRPLGAIYASQTRRRLRAGPKMAPGIPVICVGNLNVGGTGKTPTVIALIEKLVARGCRPCVVSRGYGGSIEGPHLVDGRKDSADLVGDEPLLLAAFAPTWVAKDRAAGAAQAARSGADVILMDDGFQSGALKIDLGLVVVDAHVGFGNGLCIPAGPLREPVNTGLARADAVLTIGADKDQMRFQDTWSLPKELDHLQGHLAPLQTGMDWDGLRVLAFAGIGRPEKFFRTLKDLGAELVETHALDDHQPLDNRLIGRLTARANSLGARLVATEKDAVRLPQAMRTEVLTLPVRLQIDDWGPLDRAFDDLGL